MLTNTDTIAAIATAPGEAGIAIVRVSGPESLRIADGVFRGRILPSVMGAGSFARGIVRGADERGGRTDVDEAILLVYRAPHSYTREDVVEIQCHGGRASASRILRLLCDAGARPAEPGEFTQRAFLSGRIDLLQAEAVADLVSAKSERAAAMAIEQLEGSLSSVLNAVYDDVRDVAADIEAALDFPEEDLPASVPSELRLRVDSAMGRLGELLESWQEGHVLRDGALVVIAGRPNVGKSTLMNRLLKTERSIVTEIPGTTRDTIEEQLILDGIPLRIVDTAGLRDAIGPVEREGVVRAHALTRRADLIVYMLDASQALDAAERQTVDALRTGKVLLVLNKTDLGIELDSGLFPERPCVSCSLRADPELNALEDAIVAALGVNESSEPHATISERHRQYIQNALKRLNTARYQIDAGVSENAALAASDLRETLEQLGMITGRVYTTELLSSIFSRFCIGK